MTRITPMGASRIYLMRPFGVIRVIRGYDPIFPDKEKM